MFARRRRRRRVWPWIALLSAGIAGAAWALLPLKAPLHAGGLGQPLEYSSVGKLPRWARDAVRTQALAPDYQVVVALVDLNRDERPEILVAPAPAQTDLFIPDIGLHVLRHADGAWQATTSPISCRPYRLGSFLTEGFWDLDCRSGRGSRVLRWNGAEYAPG